MAIKNAKRFAELERLMGDYFNAHITPVMRSTRNELASKKVAEMRDYSRSVAGILNEMASSQMPGGDPYQTLKVTGKWNSKTTEDYILMCKEKILNDKSIQKDLLLMASEWRNAVVKEIGRAKYDTLSQQLGCDLSYAFIEYRVEKQMIDKLVADNMPKSSAEYILRKAAKSSIFDLPRTLTQSPLAAEIEAKGEAAYKPKKWEKATGQVLGSATDAVTMGGAGSWASFAKFIGVDIAFSAATSAVQGKTMDASTVEDCISQGVFGSKTNVFNGFRKQAKVIKNYDDAYIKNTNEHLKKKICTTNFGTMDWTKNNTPQWSGGFTLPSAEREKKYKDVPLIVAPGHEEEYLKEKAKQDAEQKAKADKAAKTEKTQNTTQATERSGQQSEQSQSSSQQQSSENTSDESQQQSEQTNENGWSRLLANFGLDGFGDITKNLGYILAMLPDMLVGLFTGKTKSLNMDNSLIPLASIVAGMFVKNPILKMLLIGMGGANLLNKAGHEALENKKNEGVQNGASVRSDMATSQQVNYRQYPDEPLNPRITNPVLQGSCLVADIDHVPCTIQLPDAVVGAYRAGALPLNTLANAILAKTEQSRQLVANNYESEDKRETVSRARGIQ
jgi:hypothetical protein